MGGLFCFTHLAQQAAELQLLKDLEQGLAVHGAVFKLSKSRFNRPGWIQGHQFQAQARHLRPGLQGSAGPRRLDLVYGGQDILQVAPFVHQLQGPLAADAAHAGDIVGTVAHEGQQIGDIFRSHAEFCAHTCDIVAHILQGIPDRDPLVHQLHQILVARDDHDLGLFPELAGQGRNDVVGLQARLLDGRNSQGVHHLHDVGHLDLQVLGHLLAVGLVFGIALMAVGRTLGIFHKTDIFRVFVAQQLEQHAGKDIDRVGGQAV